MVIRALQRENYEDAEKFDMRQAVIESLCRIYHFPSIYWPIFSFNTASRTGFAK